MEPWESEKAWGRRREENAAFGRSVEEARKRRRRLERWKGVITRGGTTELDANELLDESERDATPRVGDLPSFTLGDCSTVASVFDLHTVPSSGGELEQQQPSVLSRQGPASSPS